MKKPGFRALLLFCVLTAIFTLNSAAFNENESIPSDALGRRHVPLCMLFDQDNTENPENKSFAITNAFISIYEKKNIPVLVSSSLVYNALHKFIERDPHIIESIWQIFEIPDSQLLLFIPKSLLKIASAIFKLDSLTNISSEFILTETTHNDFITESLTTKVFQPTTSLLTRLKERMTQPIFNSNEKGGISINSSLATLFKKDISPDLILDIFLGGHGTAFEHKIAGLPAAETQALLLFLNKHIPINVLFIVSCMGGGENLNLLETDTISNIQPILHTLKFIIIIASTTDQIVSINITGDYLATFFTHAAQLTDRGKSLNKLLINIAQINDKKYLTRYPHVWIPGGSGFKTFSIDKNVFILNKATLLKHSLKIQDNKIVTEHEPIEISSKKAILLYPNIIEMPLYINTELLQDDWSNRFEDLNWKSNIYKATKALDDQRNNLKITPLFELSKRSNAHFQFNQERYPIITSMIRGNATHVFKKIELLPIGETFDEETAENYTGPGILGFIQDAFFSDIAARPSTKTFLIESLIGFNDINLLYKILAHNNPNAQDHTLAVIATNNFNVYKTPKPYPAYTSTPINLKNVIASSWTSFTEENPIVQGTLSFEINDTAWEYIPGDPMIFQQKDLETHRAEFEAKKEEALQQAYSHIKE